MEMYHRIGTIKRTVLERAVKRKVLRQRPWWNVDWQGLPPYSWCVACGAEVYVRGEERCGRCKAALRIEN